MNRRAVLKAALTASSALALGACNNVVIPRPFGEVGGDGKPLSRDVYKAIKAHPETSMLMVQVTSDDDGKVVLKGRADTPNELMMAEQVAMRVDGVTSVLNAMYLSKQ